MLCSLWRRKMNSSNKWLEPERKKSQSQKERFFFWLDFDIQFVRFLCPNSLPLLGSKPCLLSLVSSFFRLCLSYFDCLSFFLFLCIFSLSVSLAFCPFIFFLPSKARYSNFLRFKNTMNRCVAWKGWEERMDWPWGVTGAPSLSPSYLSTV